MSTFTLQELIDDIEKAEERHAHAPVADEESAALAGEKAAPAPDVKGAIARLWSAYPLAGAARSELRFVFKLLGAEPPAEDAPAPVENPREGNPGSPHPTRNADSWG